MPLRHLTLKEPQYVPEYNSLDMNVLNTANQSVTQQSLMAREQRDKFGQMADNVDQQLANLGEEDRMYAQNRVMESQRAIDEAVDKYGGRDSMPQVERESLRLQEDLKHHNAIAQHRSQAMEKLEENEQLPTDIAYGILAGEYGVEYDEDGRATGTYGEINASELRIAANWENWDDDLHKHVMSLDADSEDHFGAVDPHTQDRYVATLKHLGVDRIYQSGLGYLLSNDKYREQLELAGKLQHDNHLKQVEQENAERKLRGEDPRDSSIKKLANGRVAITQDVPVLNKEGKPIEEEKNEFGEPIYKTEAKTTTYNSFAEWQATEEVSKFSQHGVRELSYKHRSEAGDGNTTSNTPFSERFTRLIDTKKDIQDGKKYLADIQEQAFENEKMGEKLRKEALGRLPGNISEGATVDYDDITGSFIFSFETEDGQSRGSYTIADLVDEELINEADERRLVQDQKSHRIALTRQNRLSNKYDEIKNASINQLSSEFENFSNFLQSENVIDDEGNFNLDGLSPEAREELYAESERIIDGKPLIPDSARLREEASREPVLMEVEIEVPRGQSSSKQTREALVTYDEDTDSWDVRDYSKPLDNLSDRKDAILNERAEELGGHYEHRGWLLTRGNEQDEIIMDEIERDPEMILTSGNLVDKDGNRPDVDYFNRGDVIASDVYLKDGQPHMSIRYREDGEGESETFTWSGETVTDMVRSALGHENVNTMLRQMSIDDWISSVMGAETEYRVDGAELEELGMGIQTEDGFKTFDGLNLRVRTRKNNATGRTERDIEVSIPEHDIRRTVFDQRELSYVVDKEAIDIYAPEEE